MHDVSARNRLFSSATLFWYPCFKSLSIGFYNLLNLLANGDVSLFIMRKTVNISSILHKYSIKYFPVTEAYFIRRDGIAGWWVNCLKKCPSQYIYTQVYISLHFLSNVILLSLVCFQAVLVLLTIHTTCIAL